MHSLHVILKRLDNHGFLKRKLLRIKGKQTHIKKAVVGKKKKGSCGSLKENGPQWE